MTKTELKKATVGDVLQTPEYIDNLKKLMDLLWNSREQARQKAILQGRILKAHPIDLIHDKGDWTPEALLGEYAAVIDKRSDYSAAAREYIREVGTSAYITTVKQIQDAKKRNKRVRKDNE